MAIVYGEGSASAMSLSGAAVSVCDIAWVVDSTEMTDTKMLRLVRKLGHTVDLAGLSDEAAVDAVRALRPDGIVAYADAQIASCVRVGRGPRAWSTSTARSADRLLDKVAQRRALAEAGLPVPRCVEVPPHPSPDDVEALTAEVDFPVVLKPRHGAASRDTHLAEDAAQLGEPPGGAPDGGTRAGHGDRGVHGGRPESSE